MSTKVTPPLRTGWFAANLLAVILLTVLAYLLFKVHFEEYLTEVTLIGGALSIWALLRLVWSVIFKATEFDPTDFSRRQLSSPGTTRLLIVAVIAVAILWWTTASVYFEFSGDAARSYRIEVLRAGSQQNYVKPFHSSAADPLAGIFRLLQWQTVRLRCLIVDPVGYEPADCSLARGRSVHLKVPGGFKPKEYHLLRLMPTPQLYQRLPAPSRTAHSAFALEVDVLRAGSKPLRGQRDSLFKQTLDLMPPDPEERTLVARLADPRAHSQSVEQRFLAENVDTEEANRAAAILVSATQVWPLAYLRKGDRLQVTLIKRMQQNETGPVTETRSVTTYDVGSAAVQIVWLKLSE